MKDSREEFKHMIYELMLGAWNLKEYPVKESEEIDNEFENNMYCSNAYEKVYKANQRLCDKLNTFEDADIECIISNLLDITMYLCMKMYDYGEFYAKKSDDNDLNRIINFYEDLTESKKVKFIKLLSSIQKLINLKDSNK